MTPSLDNLLPVMAVAFAAPLLLGLPLRPATAVRGARDRRRHRDRPVGPRPGGGRPGRAGGRAHRPGVRAVPGWAGDRFEKLRGPLLKLMSAGFALSLAIALAVSLGLSVGRTTKGAGVPGGGSCHEM